jgi:hypothetical protein
MARKYAFKAKVWLYPGMKGAWHFVTVPKEISQEIKELHGWGRRGFGSIRVIVTVGHTSWKTSIFPDKKTDAYLLPLKTDVRKKEGIVIDATTAFTIEIEN